MMKEVKIMQVYEFTLNIFLLQDIFKQHALERIGAFIDKSLSKNEDFLSFHNTNKFKNYTFNSFFKLEQTGVYRKGNIYSIKIRTINEKLADYFNNNLANEYTESIKGLTLECRVLKKKPIEKIYSLTPLIIKTEQGYWKGNLSLEDFERRLKENLYKKYNSYFDTKLDENFELFHRIEFDNNKPIATSYKNIKLLGDKLTLYIADNEWAQRMAYFGLGTGLGEANSRGFGFMNYKYY